MRKPRRDLMGLGCDVECIGWEHNAQDDRDGGPADMSMDASLLPSLLDTAQSGTRSQIWCEGRERMKTWLHAFRDHRRDLLHGERMWFKGIQLSYTMNLQLLLDHMYMSNYDWLKAIYERVRAQYRCGHEELGESILTDLYRRTSTIYILFSVDVNKPYIGCVRDRAVMQRYHEHLREIKTADRRDQKPENTSIYRDDYYM